jgi:hypothetical protein
LERTFQRKVFFVERPSFEVLLFLFAKKKRSTSFSNWKLKIKETSRYLIELTLPLAFLVTTHPARALEACMHFRFPSVVLRAQ